MSESESTIYEFGCENCGTGRAKNVKEPPQEPCDMCGEKNWKFLFDR